MAENEAANEQKNVSEEEEVMSETAERTSEQNVLAGTKTVDGIMAVHLANTVDNANQASKVMIANLDAAQKSLIQTLETYRSNAMENNRYTLNCLYGFGGEESISLATVLKALLSSGVITVNPPKE